MDKKIEKDTTDVSRRQFVQGAAAAAGLSTLSFVNHAKAAPSGGSDAIKVCLVGCGGRGSGAVDQILNAPKDLKKEKKIDCETRLVAIADAFPKTQKFRNRLKSIKNRHGDKVQVTEDKIFGGLDGYKAAIDSSGADLVVIATPPGFKPQQFEYAISKGKDVFMEKPVASDAPGVRRVLAAAKVAKENSQMVGIGLQRRHEERYKDCVKRLQDGAIGDINLLRVYWNGGGIWYRNREPGMTEMQFQVNNWYHFIWASGDQICEQHIHNLDVGCWVKGMFPVEANGMGGRELRMGGDRTKSQIFDHTFVEYTFPDGTKMYSQGRHVRGAFSRVGEFAHGSKGTCNIGSHIEPFKGDPIRIRGAGGGHYQEQKDLIEHLYKGKIYNEAEYGAKSTFTAILGREACYSGKIIKWDDLLKKGTDLCPGIDEYNYDTPPPTLPDQEGRYPVPVPGQHNPFA